MKMERGLIIFLVSLVVIVLVLILTFTLTGKVIDENVKSYRAFKFSCHEGEPFNSAIDLEEDIDQEILCVNENHLKSSIISMCESQGGVSSWEFYEECDDEDRSEYYSSVCSGDDDGLDVFTKGSPTVVGNYFGQDHCFDNKYLMEFWCGRNDVVGEHSDLMFWSNVSCEHGCFDGACKKREGEFINSTGGVLEIEAEHAFDSEGFESYIRGSEVVLGTEEDLSKFSFPVYEYGQELFFKTEEGIFFPIEGNEYYVWAKVLKEEGTIQKIALQGEVSWFFGLFSRADIISEEETPEISEVWEWVRFKKLNGETFFEKSDFWKSLSFSNGMQSRGKIYVDKIVLTDDENYDPNFDDELVSVENLISFSDAEEDMPLMVTHPDDPTKSFFCTEFDSSLYSSGMEFDVFLDGNEIDYANVFVEGDNVCFVFDVLNSNYQEEFNIFVVYDETGAYVVRGVPNYERDSEGELVFDSEGKMIPDLSSLEKIPLEDYEEKEYKIEVIPKKSYKDVSEEGLPLTGAFDPIGPAINVLFKGGGWIYNQVKCDKLVEKYNGKYYKEKFEKDCASPGKKYRSKYKRKHYERVEIVSEDGSVSVGACYKTAYESYSYSQGDCLDDTKFFDFEMTKYSVDWDIQKSKPRKIFNALFKVGGLTITPPKSTLEKSNSDWDSCLVDYSEDTENHHKEYFVASYNSLTKTSESISDLPKSRWLYLAEDLTDVHGSIDKFETREKRRKHTCQQTYSKDFWLKKDDSILSYDSSEKKLEEEKTSYHTDCLPELHPVKKKTIRTFFKNWPDIKDKDELITETSTKEYLDKDTYDGGLHECRLTITSTTMSK
jgi:hypothetical protein